jgi:hypothetical protein
MKPGDYVKREWKSGAPTQYGIVLELHMRTAKHYSEQHIKKRPIRTLMVLQSDGKIKKWFGVHTEVIDETG